MKDILGTIGDNLIRPGANATTSEFTTTTLALYVHM
jgi:hypothetical protein